MCHRQASSRAPGKHSSIRCAIWVRSVSTASAPPRLRELRSSMRSPRPSPRSCAGECRLRTTLVSTRGSWPTPWSKPVWRVPITSTGCARCSSRAHSCREIGVSPTAAPRSGTRCRTPIVLRRMLSLRRRCFAPTSARVTIPRGGMVGSPPRGSGRMSNATQQPGWRARTPTRRRGRFSSGCTWP